MANQLCAQRKHLTFRSVSVQGSAGVQFKIRSTKRMGELFKVYCDKQGLNPESVAFFFDGERLNNDETVAEAKLDDGDQIDAFVSMTGGGQ